MLTGQLVTALGELGGLTDAWDGLTAELGVPFSAPGWTLAWWESLRPTRAELRVVFVRRGEELVGVAPLYAVGAHLRPLAAEIGDGEVVARPGLEAEVAAAVAAALTGARPRPASIDLRSRSDGPEWPALFAAGLPQGRGAWSRLRDEVPVPWIDLGEAGFEGWLAEKSGSFRRDIRRNQRKLERDGGRFRLATEDTLERDVAEFMRLHRARREGLGGTSLTGGAVERMLVAAGTELLAGGRFRLYCLEIGEKMIAAQLMLAAGSVSCAWNSGFDEGYSAYAPSIQCIAHALADSAARGERAISLGSGGQDYKYRMATRSETLRTEVLVPRDGAYPISRLRVQATQARRGFVARVRRAGGVAARSLRRADRRGAAG